MTNPDKHFHMSDTYSEHSSSQMTIGQIVIKEATAKIKDVASQSNNPTIKVLDIACGPGNLTRELKNSLITALPDNQIDVTGLDYSASNVNKLVTATQGQIHGVVGSFFDANAMPKAETLIFSNEGLLATTI